MVQTTEKYNCSPSEFKCLWAKTSLIAVNCKARFTQAHQKETDSGLVEINPPFGVQCGNILALDAGLARCTVCCWAAALTCSLEADHEISKIKWQKLAQKKTGAIMYLSNRTTLAAIKWEQWTATSEQCVLGTPSYKWSTFCKGRLRFSAAFVHQLWSVWSPWAGTRCSRVENGTVLIGFCAKWCDIICHLRSANRRGSDHIYGSLKCLWGSL